MDTIQKNWAWRTSSHISHDWKKWNTGHLKGFQQIMQGKRNRSPAQRKPSPPFLKKGTQSSLRRGTSSLTSKMHSRGGDAAEPLRWGSFLSLFGTWALFRQPQATVRCHAGQSQHWRAALWDLSPANICTFLSVILPSEYEPAAPELVRTFNSSS